MRLRDDLYKIERTDKEDGKTKYELTLNPEHYIYKAHFPGEPITPGVCIIKIGIELLEEITGEKLELAKAKNIKFKDIITPTEDRELTFTIDKITKNEETGEIAAQITVTTKTSLKTKLSFTCKNV